jgi:ABC-2 type transport system permease protein
MMARLVLLEARAMLRQPVTLLLAGLYLLLVLLAAGNGSDAMDRAVEAHAEAAAAAESGRTRMAERLAAPMPPEDAILTPVRVRSAILMPVPRLIDFSQGRTGFETASAEAGLRTRPETLFRQMRLDNPALLAIGRLDLTAVVVLVAPLLLVVLGAGLYAPDRETGAARLALVEGGTPTPLLLARSMPRLGLVILPLFLAAAWLLLAGPELPGRLAAAGLWLFIATLWLLACWAAMLWLHSRRIAAETAAFAGIGGWAFVTLLLPPAILAAAGMAYPPPSRFAEIAAARAAEVRATQDWDNSHTEAEGDEAATRLTSLRKGLAIAAETDAAVAPIRAGFADALGQQQAFVRAASWAAPPLAVALALEDTAGTGAAAHAGFRAEADRHVAAMKDKLARFVREGRGLSPADFAALPRFSWSAPPTPALPILLYLVALIALLAVPAARGYRRPLLA